MLLGDKTTLSFCAISNPIKDVDAMSILRFRLYPQDIQKLETEKFIKWKITNEDGISIGSGDNIFCGKDIVKPSDYARKLSYEIFQDFIKSFHKTIKENISEEVLNKANQKKEIDTTTNDKGTCYVYLMIDTTNNFHKIGISNNPKYREHTLQSDKPTIELICAKEFPSRTIAEAIESALHKAYANKRIRGEWFNLEDNDIIEIKQTLKS